MWSVALFQYCATPSAPQGGPKDEVPPKVVVASPPNESVLFSTDKISIEFDENIALDNPIQKIWITPKPRKIPDYHVRKNEIQVVFNEPLLPNTTYNIAFGDAIRDVNEGNILRNYAYTFSTGNIIDSCIIAGKISAPEIPDRTYILLYDSIDNNIVKTQKPAYIYALGKEGTFKIGNLARRPFSVFALTDKNNNFIYDLPNEKIGFLTQQIMASDSATEITIQLFEEERQFGKLRSFPTSASDNAVTLTYDIAENNFSPHLMVTDTLGGLPLYSKRIKGNEITFIFPDSGSTSYKVYLNDTVIDTISINMQRIDHYDFLKDKEFLHKKSLSNTHPVYATKDTVKIWIPNATNIFTENIIVKDSSSKAQGITVQSSHDTIVFLGEFMDKSWYKVLLRDSSIQLLDWSYHYAKTDTIFFYTVDEKNLGALNFIFPDDSNNYIFEFYQDKSIIYTTSIREEKRNLHIENLMPSSYSYMLIWDKNGDGRMTGGNLEEQRLPEYIYKNSDPIVVKPNWEQEIVIRPTWDNYRLNTTNTAKNISTNPKR